MLRVLGGCLLAPALMCAQTPRGAPVPGAAQLSAPQLPPRARLAAQARRAMLDLASIKSSGTPLPSDEEGKLDTLLLKAAALNTELENPQIEASKLSELADELSDLQKEVRALKALVR